MIVFVLKINTRTPSDVPCSLSLQPMNRPHTLPFTIENMPLIMKIHRQHSPNRVRDREKMQKLSEMLPDCVKQRIFCSPTTLSWWLYPLGSNSYAAAGGFPNLCSPSMFCIFGQIGASGQCYVDECMDILARKLMRIYNKGEHPNAKEKFGFETFTFMVKVNTNPKPRSKTPKGSNGPCEGEGDMTPK